MGFHSHGAHASDQCGPRPCKSCAINTYGNWTLMSFRMNSYRKDGGGGLHQRDRRMGPQALFFQCFAATPGVPPPTFQGAYSPRHSFNRLMGSLLQIRSLGNLVPGSPVSKSGALAIHGTQSTEHGSRCRSLRFPTCLPRLGRGRLLFHPHNRTSCMARNFPQPQRLLDTSRQID